MLELRVEATFSDPITCTVEPPNKVTLGRAILSTIERFSSRRSKNALFLWEMMILGHYELFFLERLFSSWRVFYRRFLIIHISQECFGEGH